MIPLIISAVILYCLYYIFVVQYVDREFKEWKKRMGLDNE